MKGKKISQREAHRMRREIRHLRAQIEQTLDILRNQRRSWSTNAHAGKEIFHIEDPLLTSVWTVQTARKLGHAVIAENYGNGLKFYALPLPSEPIS